MPVYKKNVLNAFQQEDYQPTECQLVVKYIRGRGNNLHLVQNFDGTEFLVTMPKKYRQTCWLAKGNLLVIDPIKEGDKVEGEIVCLLDHSCLLDHIDKGNWPPDSQNKSNTSRAELMEFYHRRK